MLGKPEWFQRRKYGGWGLAPKTKEGWIYILIFLIPFAIFQALPWTEKTRMIVTSIWVVVLIIDVLDIMFHMKKDEREIMHEAIAERNVAWFMVIVTVIGLLYHAIINAMQEKIFFEPFMATALLGGVIVKAASNIYLERKG